MARAELEHALLVGVLAGLGGCVDPVEGKPLGGTVAEAGPGDSGGADGDGGGAGSPTADGEVESVGGESTVDLAAIADFYDWHTVHEIELELAAADWDALRLQTRSMFDLLAGDCMATAPTSPFTYFPAALTVDGTPVGSVGLRKKGFIGSLSTTRPGLKVDIDQYVDDQRFLGLEKLVLNNTPQDSTMLRTCFAYAYFRDAGVPGPRCSFAHVTVNGVDMGIYASVEAVDDHFAARTFGDRATPIFEGTLSDLRDGWMATFDPDTPAADPALLAPLAAAVADGSHAALAAAFDTEAIARFWVAEALLAHWDGYGWNNNNFFLTIDPSDGKARMLPWGPDATLSSWHPGGGLDWIPLTGELDRALARTEEGAAAYRSEARRQLDEVWDEDALVERLYEMEAVIAPWHSAPEAVDDMAALLRSRDDDMEGGLAGAWPRVPSTPREPLCMRELGTIDLAFSTAFGSATGTAAGGSCTGRFSWEGTEYSLEPGGAYAGRDGGTELLYCWHPFGSAQLLPYMTMPAGELRPGELAMDHTVHRSSLYYSEGGSGWNDISWVEGTLSLDAAGTTTGAPVSGRFSGILWEPAW